MTSYKIPIVSSANVCQDNSKFVRYYRQALKMLLMMFTLTLQTANSIITACQLLAWFSFFVPLATPSN